MLVLPWILRRAPAAWKPATADTPMMLVMLVMLGTPAVALRIRVVGDPAVPRFVRAGKVPVMGLPAKLTTRALDQLAMGEMSVMLSCPAKTETTPLGTLERLLRLVKDANNSPILTK